MEFQQNYQVDFDISGLPCRSYFSSYGSDAKVRIRRPNE